METGKKEERCSCKVNIARSVLYDETKAVRTSSKFQSSNSGRYQASRLTLTKLALICPLGFVCDTNTALRKACGRLCLKLMMKSKSVKTLYNKISDKYHENRPLAISDYTELPAVMSLVGVIKGKRVLDAGCGPGSHSKRLIEMGAHVTGIDISEEMVRIARKLCGDRADISQADFETAEFRPASFDLIIASLSLMYSRDITAVIKKFSGWLKPEGRVIFSIYHPIRFFQKVENFDFSKKRKLWIHLEGCDVTVFNYYHPLEKYFDALRENRLEVSKFIEPVLSRRYKGWPEDNYRIPRSIVIEAKKRSEDNGLIS